jgi:hypothetical protein
MAESRFEFGDFRAGVTYSPMGTLHVGIKSVKGFGKRNLLSSCRHERLMQMILILGQLRIAKDFGGSQKVENTSG